jgi:hypothetical protein
VTIALLCLFLNLFASPFKSKSRLEAENEAFPPPGIDGDDVAVPDQTSAHSRKYPFNDKP